MDFADYPLQLIFPASVVVILAASELGRWIGLLDSRRGRVNISTIEAAILGLLALMIGFTFSMALSRFEARRSAVLSEANAIGTAALRGQMLPEPYSSTVALLFKEYAMLRVGRRGDALASSTVPETVRRSLDIQEKLWR